MVRFFARSLTAKLALVVLGAVFLGFAVSATVSARVQLKMLEEANRSGAEALAGSLAAGVRSAMLTGNGIAVKKLVADVGQEVTNARVQIFSNRGEEVFAPPTQAPARAALATFVCWTALPSTGPMEAAASER